jgi:hypothetical protein
MASAGAARALGGGEPRDRLVLAALVQAEDAVELGLGLVPQVGEAAVRPARAVVRAKRLVRREPRVVSHAHRGEEVHGGRGEARSELLPTRGRVQLHRPLETQPLPSGACEGGGAAKPVAAAAAAAAATPRKVQEAARSQETLTWSAQPARRAAEAAAARAGVAKGEVRRRGRYARLVVSSK